jgi:hypothetical protein
VSPRRIRRERKRGWRLPEGAKIVDRTSRWGNPFKIGELVSDVTPYAPTHPYDGHLEPGVYNVTGVDGEPRTYRVWPVESRSEAVDLFRVWVRYHNDAFPLERIQADLGGRDLACWCPLPAAGQPDICHAAVLLALANPGLPDPSRYPVGPKPYGWPYRSFKNVTDHTVTGGVL